MLLAIAIIILHGLDGQIIQVNPAQVVSWREPSTALLADGVKCTLQTVDGKLINVVDTCAEVSRDIRAARQ